MRRGPADVRRGRALLHFDDGALDLVACTDAHGEILNYIPRFRDDSHRQNRGWVRSTALIRGVIAQSRDSADSVEAFTRIVGGRIHALARAHDQITADNWGPASFRTLVTAEAGAYLGGRLPSQLADAVQKLPDLAW